MLSRAQDNLEMRFKKKSIFSCELVLDDRSWLRVCITFFKSTFAGFEVGSGPCATHRGAAMVALSGMKSSYPI